MLESGVPRIRSRGSHVTRGKSPGRPGPVPRAQRPKSTVVRHRGREQAKARSPENRPLWVLVFIALAAGGLMARLVFWQVLQHGALSARANAEHTGLYVQPPMRGIIYDAQGNPLATDVTRNLVYAFPRRIKDPRRTAQLLGPVLGESPSHLLDLFTGDAPSLLLASDLSPAASQKVDDLALAGVVLGSEIRRYYPGNTFASQVIGFADTDNKGQYGLEARYDRYLSGQAGLRSVLKDTAGNDIHVSSTYAPAQDGADLHLTIDGVVQGLAEDELQKAVKMHHADSGTVIIMDPRTGYILGMANSPTYNPNRYATVGDPHVFQNAAVEDQYEPGSTFKIITMAAGLDTHTIAPQTSFYDNGSFVVTPDFTVHNWNMSGFGQETMTQVLQHSANVGASWVAQRLGTDRFYKYVKAFRIGQPTGIDLAGEAPGMLPLPGDKIWTIDNLFTNSYGQGLAVTPIQMIRAVSAVADGGVMMKPQVVKSMVYDGRVIEHPPVTVGRVISQQTAHTLTTMLVQSAIGGEASLGLVKGYNIAAKTGTANIPGPNGQYIQGATIASIVGYAPAYHPRFAVLVIIRHPRDTPWGSMAAAPVLHNLFQELFMHYHIPPNSHAVNG